jgi:hypothetical protein
MQPWASQDRDHNWLDCSKFDTVKQAVGVERRSHEAHSGLGVILGNLGWTVP